LKDNDFYPNCEHHRPMFEPSGEPDGQNARTGDRPHRGHGHRHWKDQDYEALPLEGKLAANFREIAHFARHGGGGKGGQGRILGILARRGTMTQREMMELVDVRSGSLSEVLGKLEAAGYILRTPNEADRRSVDVALTDKGREAAEEAFARRAQMTAGLFSALNEEEKAALNALLEKLGADWRARFRGDDANDGGGCGCGRHGHSGRHGGEHGRCVREGEGPR